MTIQFESKAALATRENSRIARDIALACVREGDSVVTDHGHPADDGRLI